MNYRVSFAIMLLTTAVVFLPIHFALYKSDISREAVAKSANDNLSNTVINLNGRWTLGYGSHPAVISASPTSLTIDMSGFNRPSAHGSILDGSNIRVTFPDDKTFTGKLESPNIIKWSNGSVWKKLAPEGERVSPPLQESTG
jgi:hypothetical protein